VPTCRIDFQVGGKYLFCLRSTEGPEIWKNGLYSTGEYKEIVPMREIIFTDSFADENGNVVAATHYGLEGLPLELEVKVDFKEFKGNKTKLTLRHIGLPQEIKEDCRKGWTESFDKLSEYFAKLENR